MAPVAKKKKGMTLKLKPFKQPPKLPPTFSSETFTAFLQPSIACIFEKRPFQQSSHEELYRSVKDLCVNGFGDETYQRLSAVIEERSKGLFQPSNNIVSVVITDESVMEVMAKWRDFNVALSSVRSIFLYLDRGYVLSSIGGGGQNQNFPSQPTSPTSITASATTKTTATTSNGKPLVSIWQMGLNSFKKYFISMDIISLIVKWVKNCVDLEREALVNGEGGDDGLKKVDRSLVREVVSMLRGLGVYKTSFETSFIAESGEFFAREGSICLDSMALPAFLLRCEKRIQQATDQVSSFLDPRTRRSLVAAIENHFLRPHVAALLATDESGTGSFKNDGFTKMMEEGMEVDLKRLRNLIWRVGGRNQLKQAINGYTKMKAMAIVHGSGSAGGNNSSGTSAEDKSMIDNLLNLRGKLSSLQKNSFNSDEQFEFAIKDAFEMSINSRQSKPAELMAKFVNNKLKSKDTDKAEAVLDRLMELFRYLQGKDVFEAFFKRDLAKRLVLGKTSSMDLEKSFITRLKTECGGGYTSKLEGMFKDIELAADIKLRYDEHVRDKFPEKVATKMDVQVLTNGYWPTYPDNESVMLPPELQMHKERFEEYYGNMYQGRRLNFQHNLCNCDVVANFPPPTGKKTLVVTEFQALVLLQFNLCDGEIELSVADLCRETGIERGEVERVLQSLAFGKKDQRVLVRKGRTEEKAKGIHESDVFIMNNKFSNKLSKITIHEVRMQETIEENDKTNKLIENDRKHQLDAIIVRCMKTRKTMKHNDLVVEVMNHAKYVPERSDIKKRIESLIERDYMERSESDNSQYNYLA